MFRSGFASWASIHLVSEVLGVALLGAIEMMAEKANRQLFESPNRCGRAYANHMRRRSTRDAGGSTNDVFSRTFIISKSEIDEVVNRAWKSSIEGRATWGNPQAAL